MLKLSALTGSLALLLGSAAPPPSSPARSEFEPRVEAPRLDFAETDAGPVSAAPAEAPQSAAPPAEPAIEPAPQDEPQQEELAPSEPDPSAGVRIVVSLPLQKAYVFEDGELLWTAPVSTGKRGHVTPVGSFPILQKKVHHRSSKYDNAPMPYMQRLTWYGIALHAGRVPGYPASHGCIRLPRSYAKKLYDLTDYGTIVTITKAKPASAEDALDLA